MKRLSHLVFGLLFCAVTAATIFAPPASAGRTSRSGDDKTNLERKLRLLIKTPVLNKRDLVNINEAFAEGRRVYLTSATGEIIRLHEVEWQAFYPYYPGLYLQLVNAANAVDYGDAASVRVFIAKVEQLLKRLKFTRQIALQKGQQAEAEILDTMISRAGAWHEAAVRFGAR